MRTNFFSLLLMLTMLFATATDGIKSNPNRKAIDISQVEAPNPHMMLDDEPQVWYVTTTGALEFYFDASCYSEYTIMLSSNYASLEYYVTTPVVTIPAYMLGDVTDIYIDSDECGAYEAAFDLNEYTSGYME